MDFSGKQVAVIGYEKVEKQHLNCLENLVQNAFCTIRN